MLNTTNPVVSLPEPARIRSRLTDLATEANFLRALLRLLEKSRSAKYVLRPRSSRLKGESSDV